MSGSVENAYRITVSVQVKDNSGGTAYAFAVPAGAITDEPQILQKIKSKQLVPETHMVVLQTASGDTTFGPTYTTLTGSVESFVNWTDLSAANQALLNYNSDPAVSGVGQYDVYIYAVDVFKNGAVKKHPLSPIQMTSDTITIQEVTDMFIGDASTIEFAEHRKLAVPDPTLTTAKSLFDFHNDNGPRKDFLYLMDPTLDKSEFVVDTVKVVALKNSVPAATDAQIATFAETKGTLVESFGTGTQTAILKVYDSVGDSAPELDVVIGETYKVYSVIHNHGLNKDHVRIIQEVHAGKNPVITDATAEIRELLN